MVTITGGIITKQNGSSVTFKVKCDKCNFVDTVETNITVTKGVTDVSTKQCSNCGNNQVTKIKHSKTDKVEYV